MFSISVENQPILRKGRRHWPEDLGLAYPESHEEFNYILEEVQIEVWTYNLGSTQFIRYLTFKNGKLVDIRSGGYGY